MRTSWKALACGVAVLAPLVYWLSHSDKPKIEAAAPSAATLARSSPQTEPAQESPAQIQGLAAKPPSASKPASDEPPCLTDCFDQETGYNWAEQMRVDDPVDCDNDSASFVEGCQAYAEAHKQQEDDSWEDK